MAVKFLHIKRRGINPSGKYCPLTEFYKLNNIDVFTTYSAYEGLSWLRKNKAEVIIVGLPCSDLLWSSFRDNAAVLSPSSYFIAVGACEGGGGVADPQWEEHQGFDYKPEERVIKIKEPSCSSCRVLKAVHRLLSKEFAIADVVLPESYLADMSAQRPAGASLPPQPILNQAGSPKTEADTNSLETAAPADIWYDDAEHKAAQPSPQLPVLRSLQQASAGQDGQDEVAALQTRLRQQNELLRFWEEQWGALIQTLSLGLQVGVTARHLSDGLGVILGYAELLLDNRNYSASEREMVETLHKRAFASAKELNNIEEALRIGSFVPLTYINPRIVISDVTRALAYEGEGYASGEYASSDRIDYADYDIHFSDEVAEFSLYGDRRQFSSLILNLLLWVASNRNLWKQYRTRLATLAGGAAEDDEVKRVSIDVSVIDKSVLHLRITEPCCLSWPAELLGTPENPGPLYSSLTLTWPGTQIPVWGLALVRAVTALHQGRVEVINTEEGIVLDLEISHRLSMDSINESPWSKESSLKSLARLLFVEDDEKGVRESVYALRKAGFDVLLCDRADRALEAVRRNECQAMILDLNLPDMNGMDLYRMIVAEQPQLEQRAVFVTGFLGTGFFMDSELRKFFADNHCLYLAKPYSAMELLRSVKTTLSKRVAPPGQNLSERVL
ncbi:MAG: response regulator [bacterium]|nr:response regulator [bacterium]